MDWLAFTLMFALYIAVPIIAIWLIARGGHKTRVIAAILSALALAVASFEGGSISHSRALAHQVQRDFIEPFQTLMDRLEVQLDQGNIRAISNDIRRLANSEIEFDLLGQSTNTLRNLVEKSQDK